MYYKPVNSIPINETDSLDFLFLNQIHNRLNFKWYATSQLTFALEARNRLFFGQMIKEFPEYEEMINSDNGYFNLGTILVSGNSWFLHSAIDRAWIDYYTNETSLAQLVYKIGHNNDENAVAGMYRFLKGSYDIHVLVGWAGKDYVFG